VDFSFIANPAFGASLRGPDLAAWYTTAWFDKYVKGDPTADARLLTTRWRGEGNLFSFYYRSRLDVRRADGTRFACEDLRSGCPGMADEDGYAGSYRYLDVATRPDAGTG
jgi:hypothetical protein